MERFLFGEANRQESGRLARTVERRLAKQKCNYDALFECDSLLERALALWPGNRLARQLREQLCELGAAEALAHGDIGLAQFMAGRLVNAVLRNRLLARIAKRRAEKL